MDKITSSDVIQADLELLENCPFCGSAAYVHSVAGISKVTCAHCRATGPEANSEAEAGRAWNQRPHSALAPFVNALEEWGDDDGDPDRTIWEHPIALTLKVGDFRKARAALAKIGGSDV